MDCSTFSNRTAVDDTIGDDGALRRQLEAALRACDETRQELHEAKRHYQTALDAQHHLNAELESQRLGEERRANEFRSKIATLQEDILNLRTERTTLIDSHTQQTESLKSKVRELQERLDLKEISEDLPQEKTMSGSSEELIALKNENDALLSCLNEQKQWSEEKDAAIATLKEQLTELEEKVSWSADALQRKKEELESLTEALHSAQGELMMINGELMRLKNEGNNHAAKGNSLFAEVEDKRQEMAKTLIQMKQNNTQLKRDLANKQAEVDSLLCEKKTLWEEMAGLSGLLDAEMMKSYEQRITELSRTVERQRCEITRWFSKYYEAGSSQSAEWVDGVLSHLKNRCQQLTDETLELSVDNLSKASQIRDLHKKVATLRMKAYEANTQRPDNTILAPQDAKPQEPKTNTKIESKVLKENTALNRQDVASNRQEATTEKKIVPKKEKTVNDVKKKVTF